MEIPTEKIGRRNSFAIASPAEDRKIMAARECTREGVRAGAKAAAIAFVASAIPTHIPLPMGGGILSFRKVPWAKANINYTGQALIVSAASIAAYFITADKTILECARRNSQFERRD